MLWFRKAAAFFKRDMQEALSYKGQLALDFAGIFFNILIFFFIAQFVAGPDYFSFVLLGIALAGYQSAALEGFSRAVWREQGAGTLEAILLSPTSLHTVILCHLFWTTVFIFLRLIATLAIGFLFFHLPFSHINFLSAGITLILTLTSLAGLGMISAGFILLFKRGDPVGYAVSGLSRLLSGVYFPAALLPAGIQKLALFLPLTYSLNAMRKAVLEGQSVLSLQQDFLILLLFSAVLIPAGLWFFDFALARTQKEGTLSTS